MSSAHPSYRQVITEPRIMDIAFDNRDVEIECGFLEHLSRNLGRGCLDSYVEICAGAGYHVHRFATRGVRAYATVCHPTMLGYAEEKAQRVARSAAGGRERPEGAADPTPARMLLTDPRDFTLPESVDLAFCPRGAFHFELTSDDVLTHLVSVAKNLGRGGLYVLEIEHPAVFFGQRSPEWQWESEREGTRVRAHRRLDVPGMDPLTQVCELELRLEVTEEGQSRLIRDVTPVRGFTHQELRTLVKQTGVFDWVATFGDLSVAQPFDTSEGARVQVPVLRCSV
jgi:hypothetical protein